MASTKNLFGINQHRFLRVVTLFTSGVCFVMAPLFHIIIEKDEYDLGFLPVRIINAELKFLVVFGGMSILIGFFLFKVFLNRKLKKLPNTLIIFGGIYLLSIIVSTWVAHNPMRALVSSLQWHIAPLLYVVCLYQYRWNRFLIISFISFLLLGGIASSLVTLDQHYLWTDWSHRLARTGYAGILYNHNLAAEYHAPLIPLGMGLFLYLRNWWGRLLCLFLILAIFLPSLSLSMARGAWVGHIGGSLGVILFLFIFYKVIPRPNDHKANEKPWRTNLTAVLGFIILAMLLPLFLFTSDYWKKDGDGWSRLWISQDSDLEYDKGSGATKVTLGTSNESKEFESILTRGSPRRLVLWEDAFRECFSDDFLFGKGTDNYELLFHQSAKLSDQGGGRILARYVHNDFIQTFYENGIFGLIGMLGFWFVVGWHGLVSCVRFFRCGNMAELGIRMALIASIICFLVEAFFEFPMRSPCALLVGYTSLGMLMSLNWSEEYEHQQSNYDLSTKPVVGYFVGLVGLLLPVCSFLLIVKLFWANIYNIQGRIQMGAKQPQKSLFFYRESISHAPWFHSSRKAEGFLLLKEKKYLDALKSVEATLQVHPGCLQAHRLRINLLSNQLRSPNEARLALEDMKVAAPYHPFTKQEEARLEKRLKGLFHSISAPVTIKKRKKQEQESTKKVE